MTQAAARTLRLARSIPPAVHSLAQRNASLFLRIVVQDNPVDTGTARANWNTSRNAPDTTVVLISKQATHGRGSARGTRSIARGLNTINGSRAGDSLHVTSNVFYEPFLDAGSSQQAPAGFIGAAARNSLLTQRDILNRLTLAARRALK